MMWVQNGLKVQYQKGLNPAQRAVIELSQLHRFSVGELASIIGMRKDKFKSRVLKDLGEYMRIDKKGFVNPRRNIDKVLEKNFDKERLETLQENIERERKDYRNKIMIEPIRRYLKEVENNKTNLKLETTS